MQTGVYVDDGLISSSSDEEVIDLIDNTVSLCSKGGCFCCVYPLPLPLCVGGGSPFIPLMVYQPAYLSIWPAA